MDKIAIVILNWNGRRMLEQYMPSVLMYSKGDATVIVADNASTDDSLDLLEKQFPEVRIIRFDENWGFAEGYNKALTEVKAEYYVIMNSDIEVTHHWLTPLIEFMDNHPEVAACQPKLLRELRAVSSTVWAIPSAVDAFSKRWKTTTANTTRRLK